MTPIPDVLPARRTKGHGWRPDLPDGRDQYLGFAKPAGIGPRQDLSPDFPAPYDQGDLGSCTGNGIAGVLEYEAVRQGEPPVTPSRLFIYYGERSIEGTVDQDAGASIRDGIKVVAALGAPPESDWPYDISQFAVRPPAEAYTDALQHKALVYKRAVFGQFRIALAAGYPIVFGISVYESFESGTVAEDGIVPMPTQSEQILGGHCIVMVGYDDATRRLKFRNSWGTGWGDGGYGYLPYDYVNPSVGLASDFWTLRKVM